MDKDTDKDRDKGTDKYTYKDMDAGTHECTHAGKKLSKFFITRKKSHSTSMLSTETGLFQRAHPREAKNGSQGAIAQKQNIFLPVMFLFRQVDRAGSQYTVVSCFLCLHFPFGLILIPAFFSTFFPPSMLFSSLSTFSVSSFSPT